MALELLTICSDCQAVMIKENPERWIRYNLFTKRLYEKLTHSADGLAYSHCPRCERKLRKAILW